MSAITVVSPVGINRVGAQPITPRLPAKSQPFIEPERRIEHLHVNGDPLGGARALGQYVFEHGAADAAVAVFRQQRDVLVGLW